MKSRFLLPLLMAIVMMAMSPTKGWAQWKLIVNSETNEVSLDSPVMLQANDEIYFRYKADYGSPNVYINSEKNQFALNTELEVTSDDSNNPKITISETGTYIFKFYNEDLDEETREIPTSFDGETGETTGWESYTEVCGVNSATLVVYKVSKTDAVPATCTQVGGAAYWTSTNDKYFSDAVGNPEIDQNSWVITVSHNFNESGTCTACNAQVEASVTINGTKTFYTTLADAWSAATGQDDAATITLLADVYSGELKLQNKTYITLDINDKIVTYSGEYFIYMESQSSTLKIVDNATTKTKKYFTVNGTTCKLSTSETSNYVTGGVIKGSYGKAIYSYSGILLEVHNVNFIGNGTNTNANGSAIYSNDHPVNIYGCKFYGNTSNKGACYFEGDVLIKDSEFKYNYALAQGGAVYCGGILTLINTTISDNVASDKGGGVCMEGISSGCVAAGTMITMADGSLKKVEDLKHGEMVRTFDHENGSVSSSPVVLIFSGKASSSSFTLAFESGATIQMVGNHALLSESSLKYEGLTPATAASHIGERFYNATSGQWDRLVNVTTSDVPTDFYGVITANHLNCVANDMLNMVEEFSMLLNVYELDSNLKADANQLAKDIATYGSAETSDFPQLAHCPQIFDTFCGRYLKIAVGKGTITEARLNNLLNSVAFKEIETSKAKAAGSIFNIAETQEPTDNTYLSDATRPTLIVGSNVIITNNKVDDNANNVYLEDGETDPSGSETNDAVIRLIPNAHSGSSIGVSVASTPYTITAGTVSESDLSIFTSDAGLDVYYSDSQIAIDDHDFTAVTAQTDENGLHTVCCSHYAEHVSTDKKGIKDYEPTADGTAKNLILDVTVDGENTTYSTATYIDLTDANQFAGVNVSFTAPSAPTYTREMTTDWGTIVLPFEVSTQTDDYDLYKCETLLDGRLVMRILPANEAVPAGTPVFVYKKTDAESITFTGTGYTVSTADLSTSSIGTAMTLCGTYAALPLTNSNTGSYFIYNDKFWNVDQLSDDQTVTILPFHAYIQEASSEEGPGNMNAKLGIVVADDATGVSNVNVNDNDNKAGAVYNLNGQRLAAPQKGINIINGKKVMIK